MLGVLAAVGNLIFLAKIAKEVAVSPGVLEYFSAFWHWYVTPIPLARNPDASCDPRDLRHVGAGLGPSRISSA